MASIEMYTTPACPYCWRAKLLLNRLELDFVEYDISRDQEKQREMVERSGRFSVPQVFVHGEAVGGSDELVALARSGELQRKFSGVDDEEEVDHVA
ncbi:MAG: glutaredoxin 3 [Pseudomonadota bacterium]